MPPGQVGYSWGETHLCRMQFCYATHVGMQEVVQALEMVPLVLCDSDQLADDVAQHVLTVHIP